MCCGNMFDISYHEKNNINSMELELLAADNRNEFCKTVQILHFKFVKRDKSIKDAHVIG